MKNFFRIFISCLQLIIYIMPNVSEFAQADEGGELQKIDYDETFVEEKTKKENKGELGNYGDKSASESMPQQEKDFVTQNIDVVFELDKQIKKYEALLSNKTNEGEREKIQNLIDATRRLSSEYISYQERNNSAVRPKISLENITAVAGVIAGFSSWGYSLSAELLTVARDNKSEETIYEPIYGPRALSSQKTYDIVRGSSIEGSSIYPDIGVSSSYSGTTCEEDMHYSIKNFNYKKPSASSRTIYIKDTYNFAKGDYKNVSGILIGEMYKAQEEGYIVPFEVEINLYDVSEPLQIERQIQTNGYVIKVTNPNIYAVDVVYNTKKCNLNDAINWTGLVDINIFNLSAGASKIVQPYPNEVAIQDAFSFVKEGIRYITYAEDLWPGDFIPRTTGVKYFRYDGLEILGKNAGGWIIKVTNSSNRTKLLQYNTKMCNGLDAMGWVGLKNVASITIAGFGSSEVSIQENLFATHIAISYVNNGTRLISYGDGLNSDGRINLYQRKITL